MSFLGKLFGSKPDPVLYSPVKGEAILNDQIPDPTFAEGILGPTFAVDPKEGLIKAPCDGTITQIFRTGHAVTLTSKDGVEILIHVGINTVDLKGEGFKPLVKDNEEVKKGSPLIEFDIDLIKEKGFSTMSLLYNNAYIVDRYVICGTRGWFPDEYRQIATENTDCKKIINREAIRLKISLDCAVKLQSQHFDRTGVRPDILVFLHFPVVLGDFAISEFLDVLKSYNIEKCFYGHIHNNYSLPRIINYDNISFILTSSDFLNFYPLKI